MRRYDLAKTGKLGGTYVTEELKDALTEQGWTDEMIESAKEDVEKLNLENLKG